MKADVQGAIPENLDPRRGNGRLPAKRIVPTPPPFDPPFATRVAEAAVELPPNSVNPPPTPQTVAPLFVVVASPAAALPAQTLSLQWKESQAQNLSD